MTLTGLGARGLFDASTTGVRHVAVPAIDRASMLGIDPALVVFLVNATATLILASFIWSVRLYDPSRSGGFSAWLRGQAAHDPISSLLRRWRAWREISDTAARPIYTSLLVVPVTGAVTLGLLIGTLLAAVAGIIGPGPQSLVVALGFLAPHGLLEVGAIILGAAIPISAYLDVKPLLASGETAAAFERIRVLGAARRTKLTIVVALLGLAAAALIETRLTEEVGRLLADIL